MKKNSYQECGFRSYRNSEQNLNYYSELQQFFREDSCSELLKMNSFALYTPRQIISDFLVRYELFKKISDVPGSIVECGVFNGQGLMTYAQISSILEPNYLNRIIYGFDTFEGLCGVSQSDSKGNREVVKEGGIAVDSYDRLMESIRLFDKNRFIGHIPKVKLIKGDIFHTIDKFLEENPHILIALLYMDLDIYKPTKHVLGTLMHRVPKGGIVAFDELNHAEFPGETLALLDSMGIDNIELKRIGFCSRISYFVK